MSDISPQLARLFQLISQLRIPADVTTNPQSAIDLQLALNPIESNADPNNPGLEEVFAAANQAILFQTQQINNAALVSADTIVDLAVPLNDAWMSYWAEQYLLRMSNDIGYPGEAQQFLEIIQNVNDRVNPLPYPPVPPTPVPVPTPIPPGPPPGPPGPTPTPTPPGPSPNPVPPAGSLNIVAAVQDLYPGSGEPSNSAAIRTTLNVTAVYVPVLAFMPDVHSNVVNWQDANNDPVIVNGAIDQVVQMYKTNGLDVILALVVNSADLQPKYLIKPTDPVLFLTNLQSLAIQLASCAVRNGCTAISIAPGVFPYIGNGDAPVDYMPQWRAIYSGCKAIFNGSVLYQATPVTVGPKGNAAAMDWGSGTTQIWDAIGVEISGPFGQSIDSSNIQAYWETAIDPESPYGLPLWGPTGWLRKLYNDWASTGRKLWLTTTGINAAGNVPSPVPVANVPQPTPTPPTPTPPGPTPTPPGPTPPGPTPTPVPTPIHMLTAGYMHTGGNQILDVNNQSVRISAITWDGMHLRNGFPRGLDIVNYQVTIEDMARLGFNAIRILLNDASVMNNDAIAGINTTINPGLAGLAYMELLDAIIAYAGFAGMRIILDSHSSEGIALPDAKGQGNGLWFSTGNGTDGTDGSGTTGTITSAIFTQHWTRIANRYANNPAILAYDLRWAPVYAQGSQNGVTWGSLGPVDIEQMYASVGTAIQAIDSGPLIICEAPINFTAGAYEGDLRLASSIPVGLTVPNKVVYGVQSFPNEVSNIGVGLDAGTTYINRANTMWGFMASNNIAPVMIMECGDAMLTTDATTWGNTFISYINGQATGGPRFTANQQPFSWAWCYWGVHRGTTPDFGVVNAWGGGSLYPEQSAYLSQLYAITPAPSPVPMPPSPPPPALTPSPNNTIVPPATQIVGSDLTIWELFAGHVMVNGVSDIAAVELAYVNGKVYAENSTGNWFFKTVPSDTWTSVANPFLTPSPNGSTVPPLTSIIGSDLSTWTLINAQVSVNGSIDGSAGNTVVSLAYVNNQVWRQSTATILSTSTYITPNVGSIVFGGHTYTIDAQLNFCLDGSIINGGGNTGAVDLYQNTVYAQDNTTRIWFTWNLSNQTFAGPVTAPANLPQGVLWYFKNVPTDSWQPLGGTTVSPLGLITPPASPPPSGPNVTFNLTSPTGATVSPYFYGVACNDMNVTRGDYGLMTDAAFQTTCKSLNIGSIRLNWGQNFHMTSIFPTRTSAADWSWIDNFINNAQKCFSIGTTLSTANLIITVGWCSWLNITSPSDWAVHQDRCQQVAQHFKNGGLPVYYWTFGNETDSTDINSCIGLFNGMKAGIKAVDPTYRVGGLDDSWFNVQRLTPFVQQCSPDFISGHGYTEENGSKSVAQCFSDELTDTFVDIRQFTTSNISATAQLFLSEFNMDGTPGASSYQADVTGAVYAAFRYATIGAAGTLNWANRWDIAYDQWYGLITSTTFAQAPYTLRPPAYVYQHLGNLAPGSVVNSSVSSGMNIVSLGTVSGNSSCCQIINYDVSSPYTVSVAMNGSSTTAWTYWELSAAHPAGFTTSMSTTALLAGITIPAMSVVVLNGVGITPAPSPTVGLPTTPGTPVIGSTTSQSVTLSWTASTDGSGTPTPPGPPPPIAPTNVRYVDSGATSLTVAFDYNADATGITFIPLLYFGNNQNQLYSGTEVAVRQGASNTWNQVMTGLLTNTEYAVLIFAKATSTGVETPSAISSDNFWVGTYPGTVASQTTLFGNTPAVNKMNYVIYGAGFAAADQNAYNTAANAAMTAILSEASYWNYTPNMNIVRVNIVDNQSGLPTTNNPQNYFGAWNNNGLPDTISSRVQQKITTLVPNTTVGIVLCNSNLGTSYTVTRAPVDGITEPNYCVIGTVSAVLSDRYIPALVHELGHATGYLGDEYGNIGLGNVYTGAEPVQVNATINTNRNSLKWNNFVLGSTPLPTYSSPDCTAARIHDPTQSPLVGLFEGSLGYNCGVYSPQSYCYMHGDGAPYCIVCEEQIVRSLRGVCGGLAVPVTPAPANFAWSGGVTSTTITFVWTTNSSFTYDQFKIFIGLYKQYFTIYTATSPTLTSPNNWQLIVTGLTPSTRYMIGVEGHSSSGWSRVTYGSNTGYITTA